MSDPVDDEAWARRLRARTDQLIPPVPVDVRAAVHLGKRRRATRRVVASTSVLAVVAGALVLAPATVGAVRERMLTVLSASPQVAEISESGPDCFADEVLQRVGLNAQVPESMGLQGVLAQHPATPAVKPGAIPPGFDPVHVVQCRTGDRLSEADPGSYEISTLDGDLEAFVEALGLPSQDSKFGLPDNSHCAAAADIVPQIYLVDADGRAIRPAWPTGTCGSARSEAKDAFAALTQVDVVQHHGAFTEYRPQTLHQVAITLGEALNRQGITWTTIEPTTDLHGLQITAPGLSDDPLQQDRVTEIGITTIGDVPLTFISTS